MLDEFTALKHFADDVAAADEFAFNVKLRNGWPVAEGFDAFAKFWVGKDVDAFELHAHMGQDLHNGGRKAALWKDWCTLHEKHDIVVGNILLDTVKCWIVTHRMNLLLLAAMAKEKSINPLSLRG